MQQPYSSDPTPPIEGSLLPLPFEEERPLPSFQEENPLLPMEIPEDILRCGVKAVLRHLLPVSTGIEDQRAQLGPQRTMQLFRTRIQKLLVIENLTRLELAHIVFCIQSDRTWERLPGGRNYSSFKEWVQAGNFPLSWPRVDEHLKFYKLFFKCVNSLISPEALLAPVEITPYKHALIRGQMDEMDRRVESLKQEWGEQSPRVDTALHDMRHSIATEIGRIVETDDRILQDQENERHYPQDDEVLPILPIYSQAHLQHEAFIVDYASIPLTHEAFQAWKIGHTRRSFSVEGVPDSMTLEQLEIYLEEHDLFVEETIVESGDDITL